MTTTDPVSSVIIASASAVAKVFVIGGMGYISAIRPRPIPLLPPSAMNAISKMNFYLLILPLVYSTLASAVTPEKLGSLWFVVVSAMVVICLSYLVATLLGKLPFFRVENKIDFDALRIAVAFPNIVALPILIFPTLCEFPVVYESFYVGREDESGATGATKFKSCVDQSNAMIFIYFFAWNILYWILGYPTLVNAGEKRQNIVRESTLSTTLPHPSVAVEDGNSELQCDTSDEMPNEDDAKENEPANEQIQLTKIKYLLHLLTNAIIQTVKSPGFIAMALGFITACIPPLSNALFSSGGALRFLGSALESLGRASASVGTLIVAASLVHQAAEKNDTPQINQNIALSQTSELGIPLPGEENTTRRRVHGQESDSNDEEQEEQSTDFRSVMRRKRSSISQMSMRAIATIRRRKPTIQMHAWFIFSRLLVTPAIVCLLIIAMDCGCVLDKMNGPELAMAKMVIIVNSCLPGAQLIVLTLKSKGLSDSASIVAKVYLPSYLLSVVTIAGWASLGLMIAVADEDGASFCKR